MSSSSIAAQSLVIPDRWKIAACYVPLLGDICSSICHKSLSDRIAQAYANTEQNLTTAHDKKLDASVAELFKLRKDYEEADAVRNLVSAGLLMTSCATLLVGTAMKMFSVANLVKSLLIGFTFSAISMGQLEQGSAKQKENEALINVLNRFNNLVANR